MEVEYCTHADFVRSGQNYNTIYKRLFSVDDVLNQILLFLDRKSIANVLLTCRTMYEFVDCPELWTDIINRDCAPVQLLSSSSLEDLKQYYRYHRKTMVPASHFTVLHYNIGVLSLRSNRYWCLRQPNGCMLAPSLYLLDAENVHITATTILPKGTYRAQWRYMLDDGFWLEDLECNVNVEGRNSTYLWNDETRVKKASNQWHYLLLPDHIHVKNPSSIVVACIHGAYGCMKRGLHLDFVQFVNV